MLPDQPDFPSPAAAAPASAEPRRAAPPLLPPPPPPRCGPLVRVAPLAVLVLFAAIAALAAALLLVFPLAAVLFFLLVFLLPGDGRRSSPVDAPPADEESPPCVSTAVVLSEKTHTLRARHTHPTHTHTRTHTQTNKHKQSGAKNLFSLQRPPHTPPFTSLSLSLNPKSHDPNLPTASLSPPYTHTHTHTSSPPLPVCSTSHTLTSKSNTRTNTQTHTLSLSLLCLCVYECVLLLTECVDDDAAALCVSRARNGVRVSVPSDSVGHGARVSRPLSFLFAAFLVVVLKTSSGWGEGLEEEERERGLLIMAPR